MYIYQRLLLLKPYVLSVLMKAGVTEFYSITDKEVIDSIEKHLFTWAHKNKNSFL